MKTDLFSHATQSSLSRIHPPPVPGHDVQKYSPIRGHVKCCQLPIFNTQTTSFLSRKVQQTNVARCDTPTSQGAIHRCRKVRSCRIVPCEVQQLQGATSTYCTLQSFFDYFSQNRRQHISHRQYIYTPLTIISTQLTNHSKS